MDALNNFERLRLAAGEFQKSTVIDRFKDQKLHTITNRKSQLIALRILQSIRKKGLSQKQLSEQMSVSPQTISKWVKGKENFTLETIEKIENALDINLINIAEEKNTASMIAITTSAVYKPIIEVSPIHGAKQREGLSSRKQEHHSYNLPIQFA
ncbi:multiprotein-bridging factor 1 family protein [Sphingobacterium sp. SG20118]|uniref:helix-turn-helix domain-containing protein n=1 Tax=Sphingobacterium sp. SG20118 TaxID=3367156 RepID=UPI0037DFC76D